jgi:hypothetical protein
MRHILKWAWMWWQFICSKPSAQRWENGFSQTHHLNLSLQMQVWISFIETLYWINPTHSSWSEKHMHQRRLKNCTVSMLLWYEKDTQTHCWQKKLNICVKKKYIKTLTQVLKHCGSSAVQLSSLSTVILWLMYHSTCIRTLTVHYWIDLLIL